MSAPHPDPESGRILPFRRREKPRAENELKEPVEGFGKYAGEPDDYRHRMLNNGLALVACVVLVAIGVWIASTMAEMRKN